MVGVARNVLKPFGGAIKGAAVEAGQSVTECEPKRLVDPHPAGWAATLLMPCAARSRSPLQA